MRPSIDTGDTYEVPNQVILNEAENHVERLFDGDDIEAVIQNTWPLYRGDTFKIGRAIETRQKCQVFIAGSDSQTSEAFKVKDTRYEWDRSIKWTGRQFKEN